MPMFALNEQKLRAAFAASKEGNEPEGYGWVSPFDPLSIDADELHRIVDNCLERGIIDKADERAMMAIYPLSLSEPEPLLSVNPGEGPLLLGGSVVFNVGDERGDQVEESIAVLSAMVEAANALYAESEAAKRGSKDGGPEAERCENCLRIHGPIQACLIGVLAGCVDDRSFIDPVTPEEIAAIAVDPLWDRFAGPAVDYLEAQIREARAAEGAMRSGGE
jgi:hypothetical protein